MSETVIVAFIVAATTALGPVILAYVTAKNRRREKTEDYARQDAVAASLREANNVIMASAKSVNNKLDVIHTLVNSSMTRAMQAELGATIRELAMMREVWALHKTAGDPEPSEESLAAIESTVDRIESLAAAIRQRLKQNELAQRQMEEQT